MTNLLLHGRGVPGDPHGRLLQTRLHHVGGHGGVHDQPRPQARLQPADFAHNDAAQRDTEGEGVGAPQVQPSSQDAVRVGAVHRAELVHQFATGLR